MIDGQPNRKAPITEAVPKAPITRPERVERVHHVRRGDERVGRDGSWRAAAVHSWAAPGRWGEQHSPCRGPAALVKSRSRRVAYRAVSSPRPSARDAACSEHTNPLLQPWETPFQLPPFEQIRAEHFAPAFEVGDRRARRGDRRDRRAAGRTDVREHRRRVRPQRPTTDAHRAGVLQPDRVGDVARRCRPSSAMSRRSSPRTKARSTWTPQLFARIDALHARRGVRWRWTTSSVRLLERIHLDFVLAGARLGDAKRRRALRRSSSASRDCTPRSRRTSLPMSRAGSCGCASEHDLAGLPASVRDAAKGVAVERGAA